MSSDKEYIISNCEVSTVEVEPYNFSYNINFPKPDIQPNGSITATLDFGRGEKDPKKPHQSHSKSNETIYSDTESDSDLPRMEHIALDITFTNAQELPDTAFTIEDTENADIQANSQRSSSNFAKARII